MVEVTDRDSYQGAGGKRPRVPLKTSTGRKCMETYFDPRSEAIVKVYTEVETDKIIDVVTTFRRDLQEIFNN
jgi:hypothetical protein